MKAVVLCAGERCGDELLFAQCKEADLLICADGGLDWALEKGLKPDVFVGDGDSAKSEIPEGCEFHPLPKVKDETDSEVAATLAAKRGCGRIVILGGTGKRLDHTLGNIQLLVGLKIMGATAELMDDQNIVTVTCTGAYFNGKAGDLLSIIPLGVNVNIRATSGLLYPLMDSDLVLQAPRGISNVFTGEVAAIDVRHGWVAIVRSRE